MSGVLILTTDDIQFTPDNPNLGITGSISGVSGGAIQFRGPAGSTGLIDVQAGSKLTAVGTSSYIAMVAPRIQQGGTVTAERSVGYIAAERADLTINAGLFNISILAGTTDSNGVVHTGTTTGSQSSGSTDVKKVYFVALPKTQALTMLLSGSIGYTAAANAFNDGGSVVLSAGYASDVPASEAAGSLGNISIDNASFTNPTRGYASGTLGITGTGGLVSFAASASLFGQDAVNITLGAGEQVTANTMSLSAGRGGAGGTIDISLGSKASLATTYSLNLDASNFASLTSAITPVDALGGSVTVDANGGAISASSISADATAYYPAGGGTAIGGTTSLTARNGGVITATSYFSASADAYGAYSGSAGGDAIGGSVSLISQNGALNLGSVNVDAYAYGGSGTATSGAATGGTASISLTGGVYNWSDLSVSTDANAGYELGAQGNSATTLSNAVSLILSGGANLTVTNNVYLSADAVATVDAPAGSSATAGETYVEVGSGSSLTFPNLDASAQALVDTLYYSTAAPTTTPDALGGTVAFNVLGGTVNGSSMSLVADAANLGANSAAGAATGGSATMLVNNGGSLTLDDGMGTASLDVDARGLGGVGTSATSALGGSATLTATDGGTVDVAGSIAVDASAKWNQNSAFYSPGPGPQVGFDATGGTAQLQLPTGLTGTGQVTATSLVVDATGDATTPAFYYAGGMDISAPPGTYGGPMSADAGDGTGGTAGVTIDAGGLNVGDVTVKAPGLGGISAASTGLTPFHSGNGFGGMSSFSAAGGTGVVSTLAIDATGLGGGGSPGAGTSELAALTGGGSGGNALLTIGGGSLQVTSARNATQISADGTGGAGTNNTAGGAATGGGAGTGGTARLTFTSGSTGALTSGDVLIVASGDGGPGGTSSGGTNGNGGDGIGGTAATQLADGAFTLGPVTLGADGAGGDGAVGGRGTGGAANFALIDSSGPSGARTMGALSLYGNGIGGTGTAGAGTSDAGSTGLDVEVFDAGSALTINGDLLADAEGANAPLGDGFVGVIGGAPLQVNGNATITTPRDARMSGTQQFHATGDLTIAARSFSATAPLAADGNVAIDAANGISLGSLTSGGTTGLTASNGAITAAELQSAGLVTATGRSLLLESGAGLTFAGATATAGDLKIVTAGALKANGPVSATGNVALIGNGGLSAGTVTSGGTTTLNASNGALTVTDLHSPGLVTASGQSVDITSPGALIFDSADATAGDLSLAALDLTATGPLSATGNASIDAANGISLGLLTSGGTTSLTADSGAVFAADLQSSGAVNVFGRSVELTSSGGLTFGQALATAGDLSITTALNLTSGPVSAIGAVTLSSLGGDVHLTHDVEGATVDLAANGDVLADLGLFADNGALSVKAGGTFALGGRAEAASIDVRSADIDLASSATLGKRGLTQDIALTNSDATRTSTIGGAGGAGGYELDSAEAGRLFADKSITLASSGDVALADLQLSYGDSGNLGSGGTLGILTDGSVTVNGAVQLTTGSAADTFMIDPTLIDIVAGQGSIAMQSDAGTPQGTLALTADRVVVATQDTFNTIDGVTDLAQISKALGAPGAAGPAGGYLQAGTIAVNVNDAFLVQNGGASSAFADRLGFTANQLAITTGSASTQIAINGVILQNGDPVTGLDTAPLVTINDTAAAAGGQFDPLSTINGCVIGANCILATLPPVSNPTDDDLTQPLQQGNGDEGNLVFSDALFSLADTVPLITPPLVDEPITGVGNDDLWVGGCSGDKDSCSNKQEEGGE